MKRLTKIQKNILTKLLTKNKTNFNELWNKKGKSNKFSYHLTQLRKKGLIMKENENYKLTDKGLKIANQLSTKTSDFLQPILLGVQLIIKSKNQIFIEKRTKDPYKNYFGLPSTRVRFSEDFQKTAKRIFKEIFSKSLKNKIKYKGFERIKTKNKTNTIHDILLITYETKISDNIRSTKGKWITQEQYNKEKTIPQNWIKTVLNKKEFKLSIERNIENKSYKKFIL